MIHRVILVVPAVTLIEPGVRTGIQSCERTQQHNNNNKNYNSELNKRGVQSSSIIIMLYSVTINNAIRRCSSQSSCYRSAVIGSSFFNDTGITTGAAIRRQWFSTPPSKAPAPPAPAKAAAAAPPAAAAENEISPITEHRNKLSKMDTYLVYYNELAEQKYLPGPVLPDNIKELNALDTSDANYHNIKEDGTKRRVTIRQMEKSSKQAPLNPEMCWRIYFYEDGTNSERWINPLMGWTSNADPYQSNPPITFETAADAVYFAKKCGWNYHVHMPITRVMRDDDAQYQDNFLLPAVVAQLQKEGVQIKEWQRTAAATSHYFRPLNYHGTQPVRQHGPTGTTAPIAPHVPSMYKRR